MNNEDLFSENLLYMFRVLITVIHFDALQAQFLIRQKSD